MKTDPTKYTTIKWNNNLYSKDAIQCYSLVSYEKKTKAKQKEKEKLYLH
jgi:hypothetical protein